MSVHEVLRAASGSPLFEVTTAPYVVLDRDFRIRGVNAAYLRATGRMRDDLIGAFMFDAFPDDPKDATATGVRNLTASLERVLRGGVSDDMGIQRYDIPDADAAGVFHRRHWSPVNSPLTDPDGRVVGALHHVEDVTAVREILHRARGADAAETVRRPPVLLRRAMLALSRYERAARAVAAGRAVPGDLAGASAVAYADVARRDVLWHGILHAARRARSGGCATAVCAAAVQELPAVDAAAITLYGGGPQRYQLAVSSPWAQRAEEMQYITGDGPSLTAFDTGEHVAVPDLQGSGAAWPLFTDAAVGIDVGAVFAYPLRTATATLGTFTLYRRHRTGEPAGPPPGAQSFAEITTAVLLADMDGEIVEEVRAAADKDDINIAVGVVAQTQDISISEALVWLRTMAQAQQLPVVDLARSIIMQYPKGPGRFS
ncbi:PAS domain-containing protein [Streptomyces sp. NPDC060205]|uniref:PAS domain-containing protein n=1 Tax=Streptomyces sp. NPDC060205 TaxID=3347072 RepID=UPI00364BD905